MTSFFRIVDKQAIYRLGILTFVQMRKKCLLLLYILLRNGLSFIVSILVPAWAVTHTHLQSITQWIYPLQPL
jgi:hypothetical protein